MGQCHEEAGQLDEALEDYATLAATYPKSPLIAKVMLRISEHFYQQEEYPVAASVGRKFLERFPTHEWAPRMAFRVGQALFKNEDFKDAAEAFDDFTRRFPDEELTAQGLFWSGESYRMAKNIPEAFRRYNRCRWDFPESEAAKYSRGRLALPELLSEFDRQANLGE
jgi:TolA-binding protein